MLVCLEHLPNRMRGWHADFTREQDRYIKKKGVGSTKILPGTAVKRGILTEQAGSSFRTHGEHLLCEPSW
jgi:hypothetical protein